MSKANNGNYLILQTRRCYNLGVGFISRIWLYFLGSENYLKSSSFEVKKLFIKMI